MLEVIGVGYGRTGTLSLKAALEQLGFGHCYHAVEFTTSSSTSRTCAATYPATGC